DQVVVAANRQRLGLAQRLLEAGCQLVHAHGRSSGTFRGRPGRQYPENAGGKRRCKAFRRHLAYTRRPRTRGQHGLVRMESSPRPYPPAPEDDWALFLDVDGCLLDFAARPDEVTVPPGLPEALESLSARLQGALALVSGRSLQTLDALFDPLRLPAAGLHGLERRLGDGRVVDTAEPGAELAQVHADARRLADTLPGALVEDKGAAIALHWRQAPEAAGALTGLATGTLARLPGYRLQAGDHVVELRPAQADKGDAIAAF